MASNPIDRNRRLEQFVRWGVPASPALWPTVLRILVVVDGRIRTTKDPGYFGLGYVLETLRDDAFAWWVRFQVQVVRRDHAEHVVPSPDYPDTNYTVGPEPNFNISDFRFTEPNFSLDHWDQVWFFGDYPMNFPGEINDPAFSPLDDVELKLLADWMDRGGGVFAAGDHWNLGSSMCSRIPRVRTMRRWTPEQGVPSMDGNDRHETLQAGTSGNPDVLEGDTIPQPVDIVQDRRLISVLTRPWFPHALLAAPYGRVVDTFPDHMHEGDVVDDNAVELDKALGIPGYERPEYPYVEPQTDPGVAARIDVNNPRARPRPHVVGYGRTTNPYQPVITTESARTTAQAHASLPQATRTFGLVGAYDGDPLGIGRVAVDSTWHHWFSYNLHGFVTDNPTQYQLMQTYYRNVGLWLASPAQRQSMLSAAAWGIVVSDPMAFPLAPARSLWAVGERAVSVLARTLSASMLFDFVGSFFAGRADQIFGVPPDVNSSEPYGGSAPVDLTVRAIVGGLASSLIRPAAEYLANSSRRLLDAEAIARHAAVGSRQGHVALLDTIASSAATAKGLVARLEDAFQPSPQPPIPVTLIGLRVVAERLQFPDATDPDLAHGRKVGGRGHSTGFTITLRVAVGGSVIAHAVINDIKVPAFEPGGAFIDLDRVIYEGVVQSGESLVVEVVLGDAGPRPVAAAHVRFTDLIEGDPSNWVGSHIPRPSQRWRLWYRIDKTVRE